MKYFDISKLFLVIFILSSSDSYAQEKTDPGTLIKNSQFENYFNLGTNLIKVEDFDYDSQKEVAVLAIDSLIIIDSLSVSYFQAFNSSSVTFPVATMDYCSAGIGMSKIISYNQEGLESYWSYFYPSSNSMIYGNSSSWLYSFVPGLTCEIWSVRDIDTMNYFQNGIFTSQEILTNLLLETLIGQDDPSMSFEFAGQFGTPPAICISSNGQFISSFLIRDNIFTSGNPHGIYHYYSTNYGSSWQGEIVLRGNLDEPVWGQISNRNLAPYLSYNSFISGALDNFGILHLSIWGYGLTIAGSDSLEISAILYWNSRDKNWMAITNPDYEKMIDGVGNSLNHFAPIHILGQSNPTISVSDDGQIVMIAWCVPEYLGEPGSSALNIYPGDGSQFSTQIYYTDYLANISRDGGVTWSESNILPVKSRPNVQEVFLSLNKKLIYDSSSGNYRADYFYIDDEIPGNAYFNQNSFSTTNKWYYDSLIIPTFPVSTEKEHVYSYSIYQNYPNPFNPSTTIRYEIPEQSFVTIKVYDILGNEIVTLVNEEKSAGSYEVEFNIYSDVGQNLVSGVYFYQLKAGRYIQTKKMILLK